MENTSLNIINVKTGIFSYNYMYLKVKTEELNQMKMHD